MTNIHTTAPTNVNKESTASETAQIQDSTTGTLYCIIRCYIQQFDLQDFQISVRASASCLIPQAPARGNSTSAGNLKLQIINNSLSLIYTT